MPVSHERRSGQDRRQLDLNPANGKERRRLVEARKTTIVELSISEAEWASYFGSGIGIRKIHISDEVAAVLARASDQ